MHLPAATRRHILHATVAVLVSGGIIYTTGEVQKPAAAQGAMTLGALPEEELGQEAAALAYMQEMKSAPRLLPQTLREKDERYTVAEGDTVEVIAAAYGLQPSTLLSYNGMYEDDYLQVGQELQIPPRDGVYYTVAEGDNLYDIADEYGITVDEILAANPDVDPGNVQIDQQLVLPGATMPDRPRRTMVASRSDSGRGGRSFAHWPTSGPITDEFGWRTHPVYGTSAFHDGLDIGVGSGTPLAAVAGGEIIFAGRNNGYGLMVKIDHGDGIVTEYAHMSSISVDVGQWVDGGDLIGYSGNTGVSTGPHLHFIVKVWGDPVNPLSYLP